METGFSSGIKMKNKTLIIQINIGRGTQWGTANTIDPIRNIFIPSVKKYCSKHNYDYSLITKSEYDIKYGTYDFLGSVNKHYSFERYFHFKNEYDFTIYIDNDVYIYPDADPIPHFKGLMNAKEPEGNSSKIFRQVNNLSENFGYYNSGVTFCDKSTANLLADYMIKRLNDKNRPKGKNSDNMLLNEFILENLDIFNELGGEWNYMPFLPNAKKIQKPNFFHFVGIIGKEIINKLQQNQISVIEFLNEIKNKKQL